MSLDVLMGCYCEYRRVARRRPVEIYLIRFRCCEAPLLCDYARSSVDWECRRMISR